MTVDYDMKQVPDLDPQVRFAGVANSKGEMMQVDIEKMLRKF